MGRTEKTPAGPRPVGTGRWWVAETDDWHQELLQNGDLIEFPVFDEKDRPQGHLICRVEARYKEDRFGRAFEAEALACSDRKFRSYMSSVLQNKKKKIRYHLCRDKSEECQWHSEEVHEYVHVDAFVRLNDTAGKRKIKDWSSNKSKTFEVADAVSLSEFEFEDTPKTRKDPPMKGSVRNASSSSKARNALDLEKLADEEGIELSEEDEEPPLKRKKEKDDAERRIKGALDAELSRLDTPLVDSSQAIRSAPPTAVSGDQLKSRIAELKARLSGSRETSVSVKSSLAERAAARAKPPLASASSRKVHFSDEVAEGEGLESHGDLGSRRMLFRALAKEQPGRLSLQTIRDFRVRLEAGDVDIPEDEFSPIFLKYLMQVYSVHWPAL